MTVDSKASAFPKSVQSGLPRIGKLPAGWSRGPLSVHLFEERRPVVMEDDAEYNLVTVKRARGGVVSRECLKGCEISVKSQFGVCAGDFLISKRQIVHGACGLVPAELDGSIVSNEYAVLRSHSSLDLTFFYYLAHSIYFQQTCFHSSIGVHVEKMIFSLGQWLAWKFDLPPLAEQRRIAEILTTWDRAIATLEKLVANARIQKKTLMRDLLTGKKRLPGFSGQWKFTTLGERGQFRKGKGISRAQVKESGLPCVRYGELYTHYNDIIRRFNSFIDKSVAAESQPMRHGDILFTCSGETALEIGKCAAFIGNHDAYAGGDLVMFSPDRDCSAFLAYLLNSTPLAAQKCQMGQGNSIVHISAANLAKLHFIIPEPLEQEAIVSLLIDADARIINLTAQGDHLRQEKAALMQQLLTGKRRVSVAEVAA